MAPRTSELQVKQILKTALEPEQIAAFIDDASLWVTEELAGQGLTEARLELIERYLACALIRMRDLGLKSAKWDDIAEQYQVSPDVTDYLLRAAAMDPTGIVAATFMPDTSLRAVQFRVGKGFNDVS